MRPIKPRIKIFALILSALAATMSTPGNTTNRSLDATCNFSKHVNYTLGTARSDVSSVNQSMTISQGRTSKETLRSDGAVRATNSKTWTHVRGTIWVGDFGDLLTIQSSEGGWGNYAAVLQDATVPFWVGAFIGSCTGDFSED